MTSPNADSSAEGTEIVTTLVVDDEESIRNTLQRLLVKLGHEVITAADGAEAMAVISRRKITCVLLDVRLPDTSGPDLVPVLLREEPNAAILMLTAVNDASTAALCLQQGAMDYLVKPVDLPDLERALGRAIARRRDQIEQAEAQAWLKQELVERGAELQRERGNLERISTATLEALVNALEAKDPYLRGHSARVADLAAIITAELGLSDQQIESVRTAGRLHDIGKIGIRESVLQKRGPLTEEEFGHVKTHVLLGAQILAPLHHLRDVIACVRSHHERYDGTGYPDGLVGETIPIGARIIGAAEVFDALTTARPYQEKMSQEQAVSRMRDLVGTVISPDVHRALSAVINRRQALVFLDEHRTP